MQTSDIYKLILKTPRMIQIKFSKYVVSFNPNDIEYETYDESSYHGIIFKDSEARYDLIHHKFDWDRMIVNYKDGSYKDLPFHEGTFRFLPACIKIERVI